MKIFSGSDSYKFEEAADLCVQAATIYRLRKELNLAGDSFLKAADYQKQAGNEDEAGNTYVEAYKCFKSGGNSVNAVNSLENAIKIFTQRGQFRRGANFKFELGESWKTTSMTIQRLLTVMSWLVNGMVKINL